MLTLEKRIEAFVRLSERLQAGFVGNEINSLELKSLIDLQYTYNQWFIEPFVVKALKHWTEQLSRGSLVKFAEMYPELNQARSIKKIAVIPEENVPLAGMHDMVMVLLAGHHFYAGNNNNENDLLQYVTNQVISIEPEFSEFVHWGTLPKDIEAYLLFANPDKDKTFFSYFARKNSLIRQKRLSVAVISMDETQEDIKNLGSDIFSFFGLESHCIRKLFIPREMPISRFFEPIEEYSFLHQYNRYANNYDYHRAVFMLEKIPFYDNGFVVLRESSELRVPVGCIYFEYYDNLDEVVNKIDEMKLNIQQIVSTIPVFEKVVKPGTAHDYPLWDYVDHKDSMKYLLSRQ